VPAPDPVCARDDELAAQLVRRSQSDPRYRAQWPRSALGGRYHLPAFGGGIQEFGYLAVILDAFSRKVVGWALQAHLRAELAISALTMAITARQPKRGALIHHSDRGVQYACTEYTENLAARVQCVSQRKISAASGEFPPA
jgi:transposase InsO family protein